MISSMLGLIIASINILLYSVLAICTVDIILQGLQLKEKCNETEKFYMRTTSVALTLFIAMLVASISLIVGIQKKRHHFIAAWLCATIICFLCILFDLLQSQRELYFVLIKLIPVLVIQAASWYPILILYRKIRWPEQSNKTENYTLNSPNSFTNTLSGDTTYPSERVYNATTEPINRNAAK